MWRLAGNSPLAAKAQMAATQRSLYPVDSLNDNLVDGYRMTAPGATYGKSDTLGPCCIGPTFVSHNCIAASHEPNHRQHQNQLGSKRILPDWTFDSNASSWHLEGQCLEHGVSVPQDGYCLAGPEAGVVRNDSSNSRLFRQNMQLPIPSLRQSRPSYAHIHGSVDGAGLKPHRLGSSRVIA